jgi:hypothetical protein
MTVRQEARERGVSERHLYMRRRLARSGRDDLLAAVQRGEMTVHKALQIAEGKPLTAYEKLAAAWNTCTDEDRARFLASIGARPVDASKEQRLVKFMQPARARERAALRGEGT